jgi:hypothetical protein
MIYPLLGFSCIFQLISKKLNVSAYDFMELTNDALELIFESDRGKYHLVIQERQ